jgi:hypothetical protein
MQRWPEVLHSALQDLQTLSTPPLESPSDHPTHRFAFDTLSDLWSSIHTARANKIRSNIMVASMFIKYLMDGNLDLPHTLEEYYETICGGAANVPPTWNREQQVIQRLRLPLQMALAISPLCLLLPTRLATQDIARDRLMNASLLFLANLCI